MLQWGTPAFAQRYTLAKTREDVKTEIKEALQNQLQDAASNANGIPDSPAKVIRTHLGHLGRLHKRLLRTTSHQSGGIEFDNDVDMLLLNLQDVLDAWPLSTGRINFASSRIVKQRGKLTKKTRKQTLFKF